LYKIDMQQIIKVWKDVFGKWQYSLLALFIALFFYSLNVLLSGWKSLVGFYLSFGFVKAAELFFILFVSFKEIVTTFSFVSFVVTNILLGILFSMLVYKAHFNFSANDKKSGILGGIGVFLAAFVPGCAACGIGLASALGIGAGILTFLPYDGIELSLIATFIICFTILKISKEMYICEIPQNVFNKKIKNQKKWKKK